MSDPQSRDTDWFEEWEEITDDAGEPKRADNVDVSSGAERRLWVVRRLRSDLAEIDSHAEQEIARIEAWADEQRDKITKQLEWLEAGLLLFLKGTGKKTVSLVSGKLRWRSGRERVEIANEQAFVDANIDGQFTRTTITHRPDKKAILAHIKETGELPEGVDLVTGKGSFTIEMPE